MCVTPLNFVMIGRTVGELWWFNSFQNGGYPPSWIFHSSKYLRPTGFRCSMCSTVSISWRSANHCWDMAIYRFFQNGGRPPSWIFSHVFGPLAESIWRSLSVCKFGWNRCSSFDNVQVFIFCELGFKVPVHDPKWVWGFSPKLGIHTSRPDLQKAWVCAETRHMTYRSLKSVHRCGLGSSRRIG